MQDIGSAIELINTAQTPEQAFERFCSVMNTYGYDRIAYSLVTDHPSLGLPRQHGLATSYPEDWMNFYREKDYAKIDPVTQAVLASRKPFFWADIVKQNDLAPSSLRLMHEAQDSGVTDGIGISLTGGLNELVGIGLARRQDCNENSYETLSYAYLLSIYFHETYRDFLTHPHQVELTTRQKEILSWAAEGKTDEDIAAILSISINTVRFHWKGVFKKLESNGRLYATSKALRLGLINPVMVKLPTPYQKR